MQRRHETSFTQAMYRYDQARSVSSALRALIDSLKTYSELAGLTAEDLPSETDKSLLGFDLTFADRRVRLLVTGSVLPIGHVALEAWHVPLLTGMKLARLAMIEVAHNGEFRLPTDTNSRWIMKGGDIEDLVCHLVDQTKVQR